MAGGGRSGRGLHGRAPVVVAIVVTSDPGPWFEETLAALRDQDYPNLSVLVIDAASVEDPTARVRAFFPKAPVRRLLTNRGFAASANRALDLVVGASHLLICHDDVAPAPDAVRQLVEEAFRSNAGVVAPKLVDWDDPERLVQVGMGADRTGAPADRVEPGELDQAQHDGVRDVFFAPGGCTLVRADLFAALSGFDAAMVLYGEDLDLSWRAHLAGARVVVAPAARVRHLGAYSRGLRPLAPVAMRRPHGRPGAWSDLPAGRRPYPPTDSDAALARVRLARRHELRAVLKNYRAYCLLLVLPRLVALWLAELAWDMIHGRTSRARALLGAIGWNLARPGQLHSARQAVRRQRVVREQDIRRLQVRGSARLTTLGRSLVNRMDERAMAREASGLTGEHRSVRDGGPDGARSGGSQVVESPFSAFPPSLEPMTAPATVPKALVEGSVPKALVEGSVPKALVETLPDGVNGAGARLAPYGARPKEAVGWPERGSDGALAAAQGAGVLAGDGAASALGQRRETGHVSPWRTALLFWVPVVGLVLFGSRALLGQPFPQLGQLISLPGWSGLLHTYVDGYRPTGLGSSAASPPVFVLLGLGSLLLGGASGLLQHLLVLGTLPAAGLGAWRLAAPMSGRWPRMAASAAYLAIPLPYDSLAHGDWSALVAYAGAPWVLARLSAATGLAPFAAGQPVEGGRRGRPRYWARKVVGLGVLLAVMGAFAPAAGLVALLSGLGLLLGGALAGEGRRGARALALSLGGVGVAVLLALPWSFDVLSSAGRLGAFGPQLTGHLTPFDLLRFRTGPAGGSPLSWALVAAGLVPLLIGRGWRLTWAIRFWTVALLCLAVALVGEQGWLGNSPPGADILLSGAGVAVAACVGLGVASLTADLSAFRFGWRQLISMLACCGLLLGLLPALWATVGGRWDLPAAGFDQVLGWMPSGPTQGGYRVLWVGQPASLPLGSWRLSPSVAYGTSENGFPSGEYLWPSPDPGPARLLGTDLTLADRGLTTQLGHLLAPMAVRYLVIPAQLAPGPGVTPATVPPGLVSALLAQDDLRQVPSDPSLLVFENTAFAPERALLPPAAAAASLSPNPAVAQTTTFRGVKPVLSGQDGQVIGSVPRGRIFLSVASSSEWQLLVGGRRVPSREAFGWARSFLVSSGGSAVLRQRAPAGHEVALTVELLLVLLSVGFLLRRPRLLATPSPEGLAGPGSPDGAAWFADRELSVLSGASVAKEPV